MRPRVRLSCWGVPGTLDRRFHRKNRLSAHQLWSPSIPPGPLAPAHSRKALGMLFSTASASAGSPLLKCSGPIEAASLRIGPQRSRSSPLLKRGGPIGAPAARSTPERSSSTPRLNGSGPIEGRSLPATAPVPSLSAAERQRAVDEAPVVGSTPKQRPLRSCREGLHAPNGQNSVARGELPRLRSPSAPPTPRARSGAPLQVRLVPLLELRIEAAHGPLAGAESRPGA